MCTQNSLNKDVTLMERGLKINWQLETSPSMHTHSTHHSLPVCLYGSLHKSSQTCGGGGGGRSRAGGQEGGHPWLCVFVGRWGSTLARLLDEEGTWYVWLLHRRPDSAVPHAHRGLRKIMAQLIQRASHQNTDLMHFRGGSRCSRLIRPLGLLVWCSCLLCALLGHTHTASFHCWRMASLQIKIFSRSGFWYLHHVEVLFTKWVHKVLSRPQRCFYTRKIK